jgi:5-methylcytosine-specific restriction enzyme A
MSEVDGLPFERGATYNRRTDIHGRFGGQQQGGISTPTKAPFIFLFTGDEGEAYGYNDGWDKSGSGVFNYTGEGQEGDIQFLRGNLAIRDHATNSKDLLLFSTLGKGAPVRFLGRFACANYEIKNGVDKNQLSRKVIVFHLIATDGPDESKQVVGAQDATPQPIDVLRKQAYAAARTAPGDSGRTASVTYRQRSERVKDYVLARAKGRCELCKQTAPFTRLNGSPYLEPHHIRRLSDGGPDHPAHVAAL